MSLLELHSCLKKVSQLSIPVQPTIRSSNSGESSAPTCRTPKHISRPSVVSKYPSIVTIVTEFIKQHGYRAHERRRSEIGTSCSVTLREIWEHLMQEIPQLQQPGIGTTTIAYLMSPPHRGHRSAERYKAIINACVPGKDNSYQEARADQHYMYLFARVAYHREIAQMFSSECAIFSCDDMNKIKVGPLAVSRYHQIS